jgi:hypothetical protein
LRQRTRLLCVTPDGPGRLPSMLQDGVAATMLPHLSHLSVKVKGLAQKF